MQKISPKLKKYAIKNFDAHLDQTLFLSVLNENHTLQSCLNEDEDLKIRQNPPKFVYFQKPNHLSLHENNPHEDSFKVIQTNIQQQSDRTNALAENAALLKPQTKANSGGKKKSKFRNFIELKIFQKSQSEKNIVMQRRIERLRNNKLLSNQKDKRTPFFSPSKDVPTTKQMIYSTHQIKKNQGNFRRDRKNGSGYIPIGYNGQRLEKKVSKVSQLAKYYSHFIDMEISIEPGSVCLGNDGKQNSVKKENLNLNVFQKAREKKMNEILNSKNVYNAVFRAPPKKITDEQKRVEFEKKFENFVNKSESEKVQLTLRQLMQFKEIVYRKREEEYFLAQKQLQSHQKSQKQLVEEHKERNVESCKQNFIKREEVNIQNLKNYEQLINAAEESQDIGHLIMRKGLIKKKSIQVNFGPVNSKVFVNSRSSIHFRSKTTRKDNVNWSRRQDTPQH